MDPKFPAPANVSDDAMPESNKTIYLCEEITLNSTPINPRLFEILDNTDPDGPSLWFTLHMLRDMLAAAEAHAAEADRLERRMRRHMTGEDIEPPIDPWEAYVDALPEPPVDPSSLIDTDCCQ